MIKQFLKFGAIGMSSGGVNFIVYNLSLLGLRQLGAFTDVDYLIALAAGFAVSVLWSFWLNRRFVFNSAEERSVPWHRALLKLYATYAFTGLGLSSLLSILWVRVFGIPREILSLINDLVCFPVTFLISKFWTFKKR